MSDVWVYGASDDLVEVEGSCPGCDEYNIEDGHFLFSGRDGSVRIRVWYVRSGVWAIAVAPVDEDIPMLPVAFEPIRKGYSARALVSNVDLVVEEARVWSS